MGDVVEYAVTRAGANPISEGYSPADSGSASGVDWERVTPCGCGAALSPVDATEGDEILYDGRALRIVRATCRACGRQASRYFDLRAPD